MDTPDLAISVDEYAERRAAVLNALEGAAAVVLAGSEASSDSLPGRWKTDRLFWYLTGLEHESGAALLFDPAAEDPERRIALYLRPRDPEAERWDGARAGLDTAFKVKTGFTSLARTTQLPWRLTDAARRAGRLACLHPFAPYNADLSPDLAIYKKIAERVIKVDIEDRTQVLPALRAVKSATELALMKQAVAATKTGYQAALRFIRPGVTEGQIADTMTAAFRESGGEAAFEPIVGSGINGTVLHYVDNDQTVKDGELIVIDYAAAYGGYASDVTRTLPAGGKFTSEQRKLYDIVLRANLAAIHAAGPGATFTDLKQAAHKIIAKAGYEDHFIHGVAHQVGIEVHDVTPDGPLAPGMVIAVEPGIYLPDRGVGVRIEDDVLITESGRVILTAAIPTTVDAIEAAMAER
jgi:Xaa-Pro aminopeptidase